MTLWSIFLFERSGLCTFLRVVMAELQPLKQPTINRPTKNKILPGKLTLADMVAAIFQLRKKRIFSIANDQHEKYINKT